jgi:hypothetical protein
MSTSPDDCLPTQLSSLDFVSFVRGWNRAQGLATPALHLEIGAWLSHAWLRGDRRLLLQVFRGAGKSTLIGLFCAWLLARNPEHRILVISADHSLARRMTRNVRQIIETSEETAPMRAARGGEWAADRFTVRRRSVLRDPSLLARGIKGTITGSRADVVVCDDVEVPATCETAGKRVDLRTSLSEIGVVLVPGGHVLYVGTPHSYYSIYADSSREDRDEVKPFLGAYRRMTIPVEASSGPVWPERFPSDEIQRIREETGPLMFRSQMMLEPVDPQKVRLDPDQMDRYEGQLSVSTANGITAWSIDGTAMRSYACWWDPALGRDERADSTVVAVMFEDFSGKLWLHETRYMRSLPSDGQRLSELDQLSAQVCEIMARNHIRRIHVECNGAGQNFATNLRLVCMKQGFDITIVEEISTRHKGRRIAGAIDAALAARRLRAHNSVWCSPFIQEMRAWHMDRDCRDDGLDAVSACINLLPVRPTARDRH